MFSSRIARIPIDLIASEVIAFPLASETAFRTGITEMDPMVAGSTGALWRGAEDKILESCPAVSVDELVALRDLHWFHDDRSAYPPPRRALSGYLRYLAKSFLEEHGAYLVCIQELSAGRRAPDSPRFADLRHVYSRLTGAGIERFPRALDEVQSADPIARFFRWVGTQGRTPEMQFVAAGLGIWKT